MTNPKSYTSPSPVYTGGIYYKPGELFVTAEPKHPEWELTDPKERAAAAAEAASDPTTHEDVNFDEYNVEALKAYAASKGINLGTVSKKADIIAVIKAADEPKL